MRKGREKYMYYDEAGREVHVFEDEFGEETTVREYRPEDYLPSGHQWCPNCLKEMIHKNDIWECEECGFYLTDDEADPGLPSLAAAIDYHEENGWS